ncbi:MAG: hypothetical protein WD025_02280 [Bacteriovoracaceae bacterium]
MPKNIIYLTTPRSGSWAITSRLALYFKQKENRVFLGEYFNPSFSSFDFDIEEKRFHLGPLSYDASKMLKAVKVLGPQNAQKAVLEKRLAFLKSSGQKHFFKHAALNERMYQELKRGSLFIFGERRELWPQFLSYALAFETGLYQEGREKLSKNRKIEVKEATMARFNMFLKAYWQWKKIIIEDGRGGKVFYYEDFKEDQFVLMDGKKLTTPMEGWNRDTPVLKEKESLIENLADCKTWFKDHFREQNSPG